MSAASRSPDALDTKIPAKCSACGHEGDVWIEPAPFLVERINMLIGSVGLTFADLADANERRRAQFPGHGEQWSPERWALALAGEAGEVAGAVLGLFAQSKPITLEAIGDELADVVCYADLLAQRLGLSLQEAICRKFNSVSERIGSDIRLTEAG